MSSKRYLIFGILLLIISSCKTETEFTLDSFKNLPKEIDGCTCLFSKTEKEYEQKEFIFASDFDNIAFVSINNKIIKLKLISRTNKPNTFDNEDYTCKYEAKDYKIIIEIKVDKTKPDSDETWWNKGLLIIENKEGRKITQEYVGESGC